MVFKAVQIKYCTILEDYGNGVNINENRKIRLSFRPVLDSAVDNGGRVW